VRPSKGIACALTAAAFFGASTPLAKTHPAEWIVYDALYAYCQEMIHRGKSDGAFR
jgi:hypothetical protein